MRDEVMRANDGVKCGVVRGYEASRREVEV